MSEPVNGVEYIFAVMLSSSSNPADFQVNPTIAAGDFKVSKDGGSFANLGTLPSVNPSGSRRVEVTLSSTEMTGSKIDVQGIDASGAEWEDIFIPLDVPAGNTDTILDIVEGDRIESNTSLRVNKKSTTTAVLNKTISGSLLSGSVTLTTVES